LPPIRTIAEVDVFVEVRSGFCMRRLAKVMDDEAWDESSFDTEVMGLERSEYRQLPFPSPSYERRRPEQTVLYKVVAENLETFIAETERNPEKKGLPKYVKDEFYNYLKCGVLQYGFLRVKCDSCRHEKLVGFS
jgi:hypothetical protein